VRPQVGGTLLPPGRAGAEGEVEIVATMAMKSKTANKLWTPEEDERLKSLIETSISLNLVAAKLQRSVSAVKNRAHVLKISVKRTTFGQRPKGK
jgi:protoporphyrinogen oxidase